MKPTDLILRCLVLKEDDQWVAMCLDFSLAAQSESLEQAKAQLMTQIREYVRDALVGVDVEHAPDLLTRRASLKYWAIYWAANFMNKMGRHPLMGAFRQPVPLSPVYA